MFFTETGLTQYEMHDNVSFLDRYNKDMQTITTSTTVASGRLETVEEELEKRATKEELEATNERVGQNETDIATIKEKNLEQDGRLDLTEQKINDLTVTSTSTSLALIEHIETSTSYISGIVTEVKENYADLNGKIMADRERIAVNETAIASIKDDLYGTDANPTGLRAEVQQLRADVYSNDSDIAQLQNSIQEQSTAIQTEHGINIDQDASIKENTYNITKLEGRMTAAEQESSEFVKLNQLILPPQSELPAKNVLFDLKNADPPVSTTGLAAVYLPASPTPQLDTLVRELNNIDGPMYVASNDCNVKKLSPSGNAGPGLEVTIGHGETHFDIEFPSPKQETGYLGIKLFGPTIQLGNVTLIVKYDRGGIASIHPLMYMGNNIYIGPAAARNLGVNYAEIIILY